MREKKGIKFLIALVIILVAICITLVVIRILDKNKPTKTTISQGEEDVQQEIEEPKKQPVTFTGTERAIAVMIDNHKSAMPQAGLNKASIVYEIIVEGGETRLMQVFKSTDLENIDLEKIGPIRSARHYFLDYALENDAVYVHFGWSPQAQSDISKLKVNNINGLVESSTSFWRVKDKSAPHNAVTSMAKIKEIAERKEYRLTTSQKPVLNYTAEEVELNNGAQSAYTVTIPYSDYNTVKYEYDEETKRYVRYSRNVEQLDWLTNETVTTKNIIITKCKNTTLNDGENKGRQTLDNIGVLEGYYITNGKAIQITCEKKSRDAQTIYKDLEGNEIEVSDGNTFIQICPIDSKITIEGNSNADDTNMQNAIL